MFNTKQMMWRRYLFYLLNMATVECLVEIYLCENPQKNGPCDIVCITDDFNQDIEFFLSGNTQGSCISGLSCSGGITQTGGKNTTLSFSSLSISQEGEWKCRYNAQDSGGKTLTVKSIPTITSITDAFPSSNASDLFDVTMSASSICFHPLSTVTPVRVWYNYEGSQDFMMLSGSAIPFTTVVNPPGLGCDTHESEIKVTNYTISSTNYQELQGKSGVEIMFSFGTYNTSAKGFYSFHSLATTSIMETTTMISTYTDLPNGATSNSAVKLSTVSTSATTGPSISTSITTESSVSTSITTISSTSITTESSVSTSATTDPSISTSTTTESSSSTTTKRSGLSEELRNIVIIVSSIGGSVVIVVVIVIVLCCKKKRNGDNTRKKHRKKDLKKKEFKPDLNYNHQNTKNTQSKPAQAQYNYRKNEKASNEVHKLNTYDYISPYDLDYGGRDIPYSHGRSNLHYDSGYGGRKILYFDGRHNQHYDPYYSQAQCDPNYHRKHYTREMPYSVPYSGYEYPVQYNNIPRQDGRQYARLQPHHGYVNQSGHVDRYNPYDQSGYARRQYDDNWDTLF